MSTQKQRTLIPMLLITLFACLGFATAQEKQEFTIPISNPGQPVMLEASLLYGGITVEGHDGRNVVVEVLPEKAHHRDERNKGMRVIPNTSLGLIAEEESNRVEIQGSWASKIDQLRIKVPRKTSMQIGCTNNCNIHVRGVEGDLELKNVNGEIHALEISGTVVAQTTNGDVKVTFVDFDAGTPMSFVTFNGDVDVTFPGSLDADLQIESGQGEVYTDFDFKVRPQKPATSQSRDGGRFRLELNKSVLATVGAGGPDMHFKTWNGDIFIRRSGG